MPPKDMYYSPKKQQIRNRAQISYLTGDGSDEDLTEALADSISSLLSSGPASPSQEVPDLMADDSGSDESPSSSTHVSPRHSTASLQQQQSSGGKMMKKKWQPEELSLGGDLAISH